MCPRFQPEIDDLLRVEVVDQILKQMTRHPLFILITARFPQLVQHL